MPVTYSYDEIVDMIYNYLPPTSKRFELIRSVYGVSNGGLLPAALIATHLHVPLLSNLPLDTDETVDRDTILVVDDIIDSGATREKFKEFPFLALVVKNAELSIFQNGCQTPTHFIHHISSSQWVVFPWERSEDGSPSSIEDNITRILQYVGEDVQREGLKETPKRVVKAYDELCAGYTIDPALVFKVFDSEKYDGIVILKNVEFHSLCILGSTFIETPKGRIPINRLLDGAWVYCYDEFKSEFTLTRCKNPRLIKKKASLVEVYTEKDTLICTPDHKVLTFDGWIEAQNLKPGVRIVSLSRGTLKNNKLYRPYLRMSGSDKEIPEHKFVYQSIYGSITNRDHIHHIDGDPANNSPENLTNMTSSAHSKFHASIDGRGSLLDWNRYSKTEREYFEKKRRAGFYKLHSQKKSDSYKQMIEKRRTSSKAYWDKINNDPMLRKNRIAKMGSKTPNHKVISVRKLSYEDEVWCMDVPKYHNFVAAGMVVHNCEHHMLPFSGKAHIAYIPNEKVIGVSKLARLLEIYTRRLQIQERIGEQVVNDLMKYLSPKGAACILEAQHMCMTCRGVNKQDSVMITSSLRGCFLAKDSARQELMSLIK